MYSYQRGVGVEKLKKEMYLKSKIDAKNEI